MPFMFLGKQRDLCESTTFVDVDYPVLMQNKCGIIANTQQLHGLLENFYRTKNEEGVLGAGNPYLAVGCDLRDIAYLKDTLQDAVEIEDDQVAILFVAEVSIAYMDAEVRDSIVLSPDGLRAWGVVTVEPGPRSTVSSFVIEGNQDVDDRTIVDALRLFRNG